MEQKGDLLWLKIHLMETITGTVQLESVHKFIILINPYNDRWVKRDADTGRFIDQKADKNPFKGVRKEK